MEAAPTPGNPVFSRAARSLDTLTAIARNALSPAPFSQPAPPATRRWLARLPLASAKAARQNITGEQAREPQEPDENLVAPGQAVFDAAARTTAEIAPVQAPKTAAAGFTSRLARASHTRFFSAAPILPLMMLSPPQTLWATGKPIAFALSAMIAAFWLLFNLTAPAIAEVEDVKIAPLATSASYARRQRAVFSGFIVLNTASLIAGGIFFPSLTLGLLLSSAISGTLPGLLSHFRDDAPGAFLNSGVLAGLAVISGLFTSLFFLSIGPLGAVYLGIAALAPALFIDLRMETNGSLWQFAVKYSIFAALGALAAVFAPAVYAFKFFLWLAGREARRS